MEFSLLFCIFLYIIFTDYKIQRERENAMFTSFFGNYLKTKNVITQEQYTDVKNTQKTARVKLGLLAVESGLMTEKQAEEVNTLQTQMDKRFGDIAIEKGYLTDEQLGQMLSKQGDAYLLFVQTVTEKGILTSEQLQEQIAACKEDLQLTDAEFEALKSNDIDKIAEVVLKDVELSKVEKQYIELSLRNIVRFIDNHLRVEKAYKTSKYEAVVIANQNLIGNHSMFTAFTGEAEGVVALASIFGKEEFSKVDLDTLDSVCEFLNCNNGLFATKLSETDVDIDMEPPCMYAEEKEIVADELVVVPIYVEDKKVELVFAVDKKVAIN